MMLPRRISGQRARHCAIADCASSIFPWAEAAAARIQGCGGARQKPNRKHPRREDGWRDAEKVLRYFEVMGGFTVVDADASQKIRLRFFGISHGQAAQNLHVIYELRWQGLNEIGDPNLRATTHGGDI
jgi:hypothetical protein